METETRVCAREGCNETFEIEIGKRGRPQIYCSPRCAQIVASSQGYARRKRGEQVTPAHKRVTVTGKPHWEILDGAPWYVMSNGRTRRGEWRYCQNETCKNMKWGEPKRFPWTRSRGTGEFCSRRCSNQAYKPNRHRRGEDHPNWKGGHIRKKDGYHMVWVRDEDGTRRQESVHRQVVEGDIGHPLEPYQTVHHIDHTRDERGALNNDRSNLQIRYGPHGKGALLRCRHCGSDDILVEELPDEDLI